MRKSHYYDEERRYYLYDKNKKLIFVTYDSKEKCDLEYSAKHFVTEFTGIRTLSMDVRHKVDTGLNINGVYIFTELVWKSVDNGKN